MNIPRTVLCKFNEVNILFLGMAYRKCLRNKVLGAELLLVLSSFPESENWGQLMEKTRCTSSTDLFFTSFFMLCHMNLWKQFLFSFIPWGVKKEPPPRILNLFILSACACCVRNGEYILYILSILY